MDTFKAARPSILKLGQDLLEAQRNGSLDTQKRKLDDTDFEDFGQGNTVQRKTRSQSRQSPQNQQRQSINLVEEQDVLTEIQDVDLQTSMP